MDMFGKCYLVIGPPTVTQQTIISYQELINVVLSVRSLSFIGGYNTLPWENISKDRRPFIPIVYQDSCQNSIYSAICSFRRYNLLH